MHRAHYYSSDPPSPQFHSQPYLICYVGYTSQEIESELYDMHRRSWADSPGLFLSTTHCPPPIPCFIYQLFRALHSQFFLHASPGLCSILRLYFPGNAFPNIFTYLTPFSNSFFKTQRISYFHQKSIWWCLSGNMWPFSLLPETAFCLLLILSLNINHSSWHHSK